MKSSSLLLSLLIFANFLPWSLAKGGKSFISLIKSSSGFSLDQCSSRWQMIDKLSTKVTFDWEIVLQRNLLVTEFRTNHVAKGYWYGFRLSSSHQSVCLSFVLFSLIWRNGIQTNELVYAIRWRENQTEISWDIYNVTDTEIVSLEKKNGSSLIKFQRLSSSGLLTVRSSWNDTVGNIGEECRYFIYMRGRLRENQPLLPDEILFNRSLCLTCQGQIS